MKQPITITRGKLKEVYASILENEKRGFEQVGDIGTYSDMNGQVHYVATMRKGEVKSEH